MIGSKTKYHNDARHEHDMSSYLGAVADEFLSLDKAPQELMFSTAVEVSEGRFLGALHRGPTNVEMKA
ncbi:unnamed protein product [Amoebophrya sp. A25]|nr:unnamed protein product [Amoebophrya sp. A25]|eukprot:GSA25T00007180001.1